MRFLPFFLFLLPVFARGQRPIMDDFFLFETAERVKVYALVQDRHGFMWLGTGLGLYRFDGQGELNTIPDALHQPVTAVALIDEEVYVGFVNGAIGQVIADSIRILPLRNRPPGSAVHCLYAARGVLWAGTDNGLYAVVHNRSYLLDGPLGMPPVAVYSVAPHPAQGLLLGTSQGMMHLQAKARKVQATTNAPAASVRVVRPVLHTPFAWTAGADGISRRTLDQVHASSLSAALRPEWGAVQDLVALSPQHAWAGTDAGYLLDLHAGEAITIQPYYYPDKSFNALLYTRSGSVWTGTHTGLTELSAGFAAELELDRPYNMNDLTATTCDQQHNVWLAELNELYRMPLDGSAPLRHTGTLPAIVSCLFTDKDNTVWLGTAGRGLWRLQGAQPVPVTVHGANGIDTIFSMAVHEGQLWLSGVHGVDACVAGPQGLQVTRHYAPDEIGGLVYYLYNDRKDRLWLATEGAGLGMYDGQYRRFDTGAGLTSRAICTITEDRSGDIWAGAPDGGVSRYDGRRWQSFTHQNGLQNRYVSTVIANGTGEVLVVHAIGVDEWFPGSGCFRHFNFRTTPSIDSVSNVPNIAFRDTAGNVYVPGLKGLLRFRNTEEPIVLRPNVRIDSISVFQQAVPFGKSTFRYRENNISFRFAGVNFTNYERLHYRYRLQGYNDDWVVLSEEEVTFPQLNPGQYTFRVQASLAPDFRDAAEDAYSFSVQTPLWQQPWAIVLMVLGIAATIRRYIRYRERQLRNLAQLRQERILFEYELFKSQVNPHFLFNSLNILTNLIEEDQERAIDYTVQLSALYRNILSYRDKDTVLLAEECRLLSSYLHIQKRRFGEALQLEVDIPDNLLQRCRIIPLALQVLVENAIKHNMISAAQPLPIRIYSTGAGELIVRNPVRPKVSVATGAGLGLQHICKRYSLLTEAPVWYGTVDGDYLVKLPLLWT